MRCKIRFCIGQDILDGPKVQVCKAKLSREAFAPLFWRHDWYWLLWYGVLQTAQEELQEVSTARSLHPLIVPIKAYSYLCLKKKTRLEYLILTEADWWWQNCESTEIMCVCRWYFSHQSICSHQGCYVFLFRPALTFEISFLWDLLETSQRDQLNNCCCGKTHWVSTDSCCTALSLIGSSGTPILRWLENPNWLASHGGSSIAAARTTKTIRLRFWTSESS